MNSGVSGATVLAVGLGLASLGVALGAAGVLAIRHDRRRARLLVETIGTIVATGEVEDEGRARYERVVEFRPDGGVAIRVTDGATYDRPRWAIGEAVSVRYDPSQPHAEPQVGGGPSGHFIFGWMLFGMGCLLVAIGAFFIAAARLGPAHPFVRFGSQFFEG